MSVFAFKSRQKVLLGSDEEDEEDGARDEAEVKEAKNVEGEEGTPGSDQPKPTFGRFPFAKYSAQTSGKPASPETSLTLEEFAELRLSESGHRIQDVPMSAKTPSLPKETAGCEKQKSDSHPFILKYLASSDSVPNRRWSDLMPEYFEEENQLLMEDNGPGSQLKEEEEEEEEMDEGQLQDLAVFGKTLVPDAESVAGRFFATPWEEDQEDGNEFVDYYLRDGAANWQHVLLDFYDRARECPDLVPHFPQGPFDFSGVSQDLRPAGNFKEVPRWH